MYNPVTQPIKYKKVKTLKRKPKRISGAKVPNFIPSRKIPFYSFSGPPKMSPTGNQESTGFRASGRGLRR